MMRRELFKAEGMPVLQNRVFPTAQAAQESATGDVVLVQDEKSGLVFNAAFDPDKLTYDDEYQNEQACSTVFVEHLDNVTAVIDRSLNHESLLEVGCGKGFFLNHLKSKGYEVGGLDPAYEGTDENIQKATLDQVESFSASGIILRHVLEHIQDPFSFLSVIARKNNNQGRIYIEVPCFDWIVQNGAWFDIFYEHVNYFRMSDFTRMFGSIVEEGHLFGGQYLYVVADLSSLREPVCDTSDLIDFPTDFLSSIHTLSKIQSNNGRNVIWGASSKGVIFSIYMMRAGVQFDFAIDINPAKQGKYMACSGLQILSPEEAMKTLEPKQNVFVMNKNYMDEIVAQSGSRYNYYKVEHE